MTQTTDRPVRQPIAVFPPQVAASVHREPLNRPGPLPGTASLDTDLVITAANPEFYRTFARTSVETCGSSVYELFHPSAQSVLPRYFNQLVDERRTQFVVRALGMHGPEKGFYAEVSCVAIRGEDHSLSGFVIQVSANEVAAAGQSVVGLPKPLLSPLDARILEAIATGSSTLQMAARLYLSRQGVEYHVGLMLRQLKVPNRTALVSRAYSMGVLTLGSWPPRVLPEFIK